jgi:predicted RNA polymerase sigma factor
MTAADAHRAILAVWRIEQPRLITGLARMLRDVPLAEDLTQEALVAALERWPATGVPEKPGAWLMATAKRRAFVISIYVDCPRTLRWSPQPPDLLAPQMMSTSAAA